MIRIGYMTQAGRSLMMVVSAISLFAVAASAGGNDTTNSDQQWYVYDDTKHLCERIEDAAPTKALDNKFNIQLHTPDKLIKAFVLMGSKNVP